MCVCQDSIVVAFEPVPGVRLAAFWDGGEWCDVHAAGTGYGPRVEQWLMVDPATGAVAIPYTVDSLRELVAFRLLDPAAAEELVDRFVAVAGRREVTPGGRRTLVAFSAN